MSLFPLLIRSFYRWAVAAALAICPEWFNQMLVEKLLIRRYRKIFKRRPGSPPTTFSEKMLRRLIWYTRGHDEREQLLSDKFRVRDVVAQQIGAEFLVPLIWSGENIRDIPFDELPQKVFINMSHGSGMGLVFQRGDDRRRVVSQLKRWRKTSHYLTAFEHQYSKIKPVVLVEEFIDDLQENGPLDYRFWCFGGNTRLIQIDDHLHSINCFYDKDWNRLDIRYRQFAQEASFPKPEALDTMLSVAETLASGHSFVRIDLYLVQGRVFFGEFTFSPVAGAIRFEPPRWDLELGELWTKVDS